MIQPRSEVDSIDASRRPRVLVAGLFHETHTFLSPCTAWNAFTLHRGQELFSLTGDASPMGGMLQYAAEHDWDVLPTIAAAALPSGMVEDDVYHRFIDEFTRLASRYFSDRVDGIFLVLHGALACENRQDVEGDFLRHLKELVGAAEIPVYCVFDLHAHLTDAMIEHSDCLVAYRENPHCDARESSIRAAGLLDLAMSTRRRSRQFLLRPPIVWPPTGTASADEPMRSLLQLARELESKHPDFLAINVVPGFAFGDTHDTGLCFSVATLGKESTAREALEQLSAVAMSLAADGCRQDTDVDELLDMLKSSHCNGLCVIAEPADNIGGGAPGDATGLLRALVRHNVNNSAVCIFDPEAVQQLENYHPGAIVTLSIGGKSTRLDPGPLEVTGTLLRLCDGRFELEDKQSHLASAVGDLFDMGRCAIIETSGITILLTSHRTPPMDLGQWRSVGLPPEKFAVIGVKAAVAHRRAYEPIATTMVSVNTPGPCGSNLRLLPYKNIRRPIYPLDSLESAKRSASR